MNLCITPPFEEEMPSLPLTEDSCGTQAYAVTLRERETELGHSDDLMRDPGVVVEKTSKN